MRLTSLTRVGVLLACALPACGKTDPSWWADIYADDTGDEVAEDSDSGSESSGSESSDSESESNTTIDSESSTDVDTLDSSSTASDSTDSTDSTDSSSSEGCQPSAIDLSISDPPTVVFLLEQASHMNDDLGGISRWDAAGTALFDPMQGVAPAFEDEMRLGLSMFTSFNGGPMCPALVESAPALANATAMQMAWMAEQPEDENPVGDAIAQVSAELAMDASPGSKTIVLLTARNPDTCAQPNPQSGATAAQIAANDAFQAGIGTRLITMGGLANPYAQGLANVGVGLPAQGMTNAPWSSPADVDELIADLDAVLGSLLPCSFTLAQALVPDGEQACTLALEGQPLVLDDPDGWSMVDDSTLLLQGQACSSFQQLGSPPELVCECEALP